MVQTVVCVCVCISVPVHVWHIALNRRTESLKKPSQAQWQVDGSKGGCEQSRAVRCWGVWQTEGSGGTAGGHYQRPRCSPNTLCTAAPITHARMHTVLKRQTVQSTTAKIQFNCFWNDLFSLLGKRDHQPYTSNCQSSAIFTNTLIVAANERPSSCLIHNKHFEKKCKLISPMQNLALLHIPFIYSF